MGTARDTFLTQRRFHYQNSKLKSYLRPSGFCKKVGYFVIALLFALTIGNTVLFSCKISLPDTAACNIRE